jgi:chemotaxis protein methyltransferase CheR
VTAGVGIDSRQEITAAEFAWIKEFLREHTGIELKPGKEPMVMGRLDRRLRHHGLTRYTEYIRRLSEGNDPQEIRLAIDLLTTNETYFFREPAHFQVLRDLLAAMPSRGTQVRVWSAASSSGEEAWTIAMTLADTLAGQRPWEVIGTDISSRVLETAQRGLYPIDAADKIPRPLLQTYCLRGRDEYEGLLTIDPVLRERVRFRHANLLELPNDLGLFDVIFLRNVMIYFGQETKRGLVQRVVGMLRPGGYLIVSHSETLNGISAGLKMVTPSVYRADGADE